MTLERLRAELERRSSGHWEIYRKSAESREGASSATARTLLWRREEGWAARWWERGAPRFAAASSARELISILPTAAALPALAEETPEWPVRTIHLEEREPAVEEPPDLFDAFSREISAASRGEALLTELKLRRGQATERIENGRGLSAAIVSPLFDGVASAVGRRGSRACEARALLRFEGPPDFEAVARRLADRATLPLSDGALPFSRGEWLLDPSVAAAILAALAPLFARDSPPRWVTRRAAAPCVSVVDDASADASIDGEGTLTRRLSLIEEGVLRRRFHDLQSARRAGDRSTGHGVRRSFRTPPGAAPRRLFFETTQAVPPRDLLGSVRRGIFASGLTAPVRLEIDRDRYEVEFTGIAVVAGRAQGAVAAARARGRLSELLARIGALGADRLFFPMPYPVGAPTVLVERTSFE
jgi:predicted Zn-dependent protease